MCTVITLVKNGLFFGRNMDIDYDPGLKIVAMPREFPLTTKRAGALLKHYAIIGAARVEDGYPLYAEACNEKGLCMAGLNFPFNAKYADRAEKEKIAVTPYELIPYVLGKCADINEAKKLFENTEIIGIPFKESLPLAPLHWIVADRSGSFVVERTDKGVSLYDDPCGVLTNNPPFPSHLENIERYKALSVENSKNTCSRVDYSTFSEGEGALGLPGDFSSPSRFVKAWFCLKNSVCGESMTEKVAQTFRILNAVAMTKGSVVTQSGNLDQTTYLCCIDAENAVYYYKTYDGLNVNCVRINDTDGSTLEVTDM